MLNINITSRLPAVMIGLLIFCVPFFTYLTPENLKQLSGSNVLEIFISLIAVLTIIFISSFSVDLLIKRLFNKNIVLFPLLCFAFYLNFFYTPFLEFLQDSINPKFGYIGLPVFIILELFCIAIIVFGAKFNVFVLRMFFIFSSLMLIIAIIPLVGYLFANIEKNPTSSYEIKTELLDTDDVLKKRNVYYIVLDGMMDIESAAKVNITSIEEVLDSLSIAGLKYIDKSLSSYNFSRKGLGSIMLVDNHPEPMDSSNLYSSIMYKHHTEIPLVSYLKEANSSFIWTGNSWTACNTFTNSPEGRLVAAEWQCINSKNNFLSNNLFKFYLSTPIPQIYLKIFKNVESQFAIEKFLNFKYINGTPKTPFFAFIHHNSPHRPYLVTSECEPNNYLKRKFEGYKASYKCALKKVTMFMEKINNTDPDAIVIFQGDHGWNDIGLELTDNEMYLLHAKIFNAIKAPEICFDKYGLPKTNVNTIRFVLNCAYGFKLPYRKNIHHITYRPEDLYNPFFTTERGKQGRKFLTIQDI